MKNNNKIYLVFITMFMMLPFFMEKASAQGEYVVDENGNIWIWNSDGKGELYPVNGGSSNDGTGGGGSGSNGTDPGGGGDVTNTDPSGGGGSNGTDPGGGGGSHDPNPSGGSGGGGSTWNDEEDENDPHLTGDGYEDPSDLFWWDEDEDYEDGCFKLFSRTQVSLPANRTRKELGIGEQITLYVLDLDLTAGEKVEWSIISNNNTEASIISNLGDEIDLNVGYMPGSFQVRAKILNKKSFSCPESLELNFMVLEPNGVFFEGAIHECPTGLAHHKNRPSILYQADYYIQPHNVNFYNVKIKEGATETDTDQLKYIDSYWNDVNPPVHKPASEWSTLSQKVVENKGTKANGWDKIGGALVCNNLVSAERKGTVVYIITWEYQRFKNGIEEEIRFTEVTQVLQNKGGFNSEFIASKGITAKGTVSGSKLLLEEDSCRELLVDKEKKVLEMCPE
jgi:hypothetical protein